MSEENYYSDRNIQSLYDLNQSIKRTLNEKFSSPIWVRAEMSDVRINQNGHCYLEFIEKDSNGKSVTARIRGVIWSNTFRLLKAYFEAETGQTFTSGLKVLVEVGVDFHEAYGLNLTVYNIDPSYTLGDQAKNRLAIMKQLEEDGVINLNKELLLPQPTNHIAIISSPTAAGYEDFMEQLANNPYGFRFYTHLFPAIMQGERTEASIISALERIYEYYDNFDAVVIIRGGGATSELSSFDSYLLATNCAQFPLPIITGIGHERDDTILDIIAHTRAKTPTAVAEFLIGEMLQLGDILLNLEDSLKDTIKDIISEKRKEFETLSARYSYLSKGHVKEQLKELSNISIRLKVAIQQMLINRGKDISLKEEQLRLISPETILKKGYTLTLKNNLAVKSKDTLKSGDKITTLFKDGEIHSTVE